VDTSDVVDVELLSAHKDASMPGGSAFGKRLYPLLWLVIAALWSKDMLDVVVGFVGNIVWTAWKTYLGLTDLLSFGVSMRLMVLKPKIGRMNGSAKGKIMRRVVLCSVADSWAISSSTQYRK
jgi:hypothetical protein